MEWVVLLGLVVLIILGIAWVESAHDPKEREYLNVDDSN